MANIFNIPAGPKNLKALFPSLDFGNMKEYTLEVLDSSGNVIATTPLMKLQCVPEKFVRLHFLNNLGTYDAVNFLKPIIVHEDQASEYQKPLVYPLIKEEAGNERFDVTSNDTYEAKHYFNEDDMPWLREMADSPKIFLQWEGIEGQLSGYIPVIKISGKLETLKNFDDFRYEFVIQYKLSNEYITVRN